MFSLCTGMQASGLVPIVEPEVLLDGEHDIDATLEVAQAIWAETFKYMADNKVCSWVTSSSASLFWLFPLTVVTLERTKVTSDVSTGLRGSWRTRFPDLQKMSSFSLNCRANGMVFTHPCKVIPTHTGDVCC